MKEKRERNDDRERISTHGKEENQQQNSKEE